MRLPTWTEAKCESYCVSLSPMLLSECCGIGAEVAEWGRGGPAGKAGEQHAFLSRLPLLWGTQLNPLEIIPLLLPFALIFITYCFLYCTRTKLRSWNYFAPWRRSHSILAIWKMSSLHWGESLKIILPLRTDVTGQFVLVTFYLFTNREKFFQEVNTMHLRSSTSLAKTKALVKSLMNRTELLLHVTIAPHCRSVTTTPAGTPGPGTEDIFMTLLSF